MGKLYLYVVYLGATVLSGIIKKAILVHNPICFGAFGCFSHVKNEGFFDAHFPAFGGDDLVGSGGFPVTRPGYSVGSGPVWVLSVSRAEEVPFFLTEKRLACLFN